MGRPASITAAPARAVHAGFTLLLIVFTASVGAHDLARSESRCTIEGPAVRCELIVDLLTFAGVDQDGNGSVSYAELDQSIAAVFARVKEHFVLRSLAEPVQIQMTRHELVDEHTARLVLSYTFPENVSRLDVTSTFDQLSRRPDHQHFVTTTDRGGEQRAILDASHRTVTFEYGRWTRTAIWLTVGAVLIVGLRVGWFLRSRGRRSVRL